VSVWEINPRTFARNPSQLSSQCRAWT